MKVHEFCAVSSRNTIRGNLESHKAVHFNLLEVGNEFMQMTV